MTAITSNVGNYWALSTERCPQAQTLNAHGRLYLSFRPTLVLFPVPYAVKMSLHGHHVWPRQSLAELSEIVCQNTPFLNFSGTWSQLYKLSYAHPFPP